MTHMDKNAVYDMLRQKNIAFEITEHKAVFSMAELVSVPVPYPEADAKNLFLKDDKRRGYYLLVVRGDKKADIKAFRRFIGAGKMSFASADELDEIMGLKPGSVSPFGVLCDDERKVSVFIDEEFAAGPGLMGVHPNDNTATVWIKTADMTKLIEEHGNPVRLARL